MINNRRRRLLILALALAAAIVPAAAMADEAVVVGINHYPRLGEGESGGSVDLAGCVNDAKTMKAILENKYHFNVTILTDDQATQKGILDAIKQAGHEGGQRFVFFFAGHGTHESDGGAAILPSDAYGPRTPPAIQESHDITPKELNAAVEAVPEAQRSIILDSCFSGGFIKRGLQGRRLVSRYYERHPVRTLTRGLRDKNLVSVPCNNQDDNHALTQGTGICYFSASRGNEYSAEDDFGGVRDGVFTHYLTQALDGEKFPWGLVQERVSAKVVEDTDDQQHPTLSPNHEGQPIFGGGNAPAPTPVAAPSHDESLWDQFNGDHAGSGQVQVTVEPDRSQFKVNDHVVLNCKVGANNTSYLVVVERGTDDKLHLLFPESAKAADAQMMAGAVRRVPEEGYHFLLDAPGTERVKAILFTNEAEAQALMNQFGNGKTLTRAVLRRALSSILTRNFRLEQDAAPLTFYTSEVDFEVAPAS